MRQTLSFDHRCCLAPGETVRNKFAAEPPSLPLRVAGFRNEEFNLSFTMVAMDTPMETLQIAIALVRRYDQHQNLQWLSLWDSRQKHFDFIWGTRLEKESFRETVTREVAWQLDINRNEFLVSNMAQLNFEMIDQLPGDSTERPIAVSFYPVDLYRRKTREKLEQREGMAWLTSSDLYRAQTSNGSSICPRLLYLIEKSQVIQMREQ